MFLDNENKKKTERKKINNNIISLTKSSPHSLTVFDYLIFVIIRHRRKTIWPGFAIETKASSKLSRRKLRASSLAHARTHAHNQPNSSTHTHTSDITHSRL